LAKLPCPPDKLKPPMSAPTTLRHFNPQHDQAAVGGLWTAVFGADSIHNEPEFAVHQQRAVDEELFFVAERELVVVGTVLAGFAADRGWIYCLAVRSNQRHRGIGRGLLRRAEKALASRGCETASLQVAQGETGALQFYERSGYLATPLGTMSRRLAGY
jgi:ribosomal protein S18 acetylase RimI-like enzyme